MHEPALHGWRLADNRHMRMSGYPGRVRSMSWSAGGKGLATSGADTVIIWPFTSKDGPMGKEPAMLAPLQARVSVVACHPKQDIMAAGYSDGTVLIVRLEDGAEILVRRNGSEPVSALAWNAKGTLLAFGTEDGDAGLVPTLSRFGRAFLLRFPCGTMRRCWPLIWRTICGVDRHACRRPPTRIPTGNAARVHADRGRAGHFGACADRCAQPRVLCNRAGDAADAIDAGRGNKAVRAVRASTTGQRPSDIPPQPARPDPDAQKAGAQPALPPAPAEKVAPPIREK